MQHRTAGTAAESYQRCLGVTQADNLSEGLVWHQKHCPGECPVADGQWKNSQVALSSLKRNPSSFQCLAWCENEAQNATSLVHVVKPADQELQQVKYVLKC